MMWSGKPRARPAEQGVRAFQKEALGVEGAGGKGEGEGEGGGDGVLPLMLPEHQRGLREIDAPNEPEAITANTANAPVHLK